MDTGLILNKVDRQGHFSCESDRYEITSQAANIVEELNSTQEDADTRLILRAAHAAKSGHKAVVVVSEYTNVFLLCLAFNCIHVCQVWSADKN